MAYRNYYSILKQLLLVSLDDETVYSCLLHVENFLEEHSAFGCGFSSSYKARSSVSRLTGNFHVVKWDNVYYSLPNSDFIIFKSSFDSLLNCKGFINFSDFCFKFENNLSFVSHHYSLFAPLPDIVNSDSSF